MSCEPWEPKLSFWIDDELDAESRARLEEHLKGCGPCRAALDRLRSADEALRKGARSLVVSPGPGLLDRTLRGLRVRRAMTVFRRLAVSAAALLVVSGASYLLYLETRSAPTHNLRVFGETVFAPGAPSLLRVLVEHARTGRPVASTVRVLLDGDEIGRASALEGEVCSVPVRLPEIADGNYSLQVITEAATGSERLEIPVEVRRPIRLFLTTDKPLYQPEQQVLIRLLAKNALSGKPVAGGQGDLEIVNPNGVKLLQRTLTTSEFGIAHYKFTLADEVVFGTYLVRVRMGEVESERTFDVRRYVLPKFRVDASLDRSFYAPGDTARLRVAGRYFFGKPVPAREVKVRFLTRIGAQFSFVSEEIRQVEGDWEGEFVVRDVEQVRFEVELKDSAGHVETGFAAAAVSRHALRVAAIPYGGTFLPRRENLVYLVATRPDGAPARATIRVEGRTLETDENGVAKIWIARPRFGIEASDGSGAAVREDLDLSSFRVDRGIVALVDRVRLRGGDTIQVRLLSSSPQGTAYLDLVKEKQTLLTKSVPIVDGEGAVELDLPPELSGTVELTAYRFDGRGVVAMDRRPLLVEAPQDLSVQVLPARPVTEPGEPIDVEVRVSAEGQPVRAALGLSAVDAAVFALYETYPGLEKVFFQIEEDLLKPRWQLKDCPPLSLPVSAEHPPELLQARLSNVEPPSLSALARIDFAQREERYARERRQGREFVLEGLLGLIVAGGILAGMVKLFLAGYESRGVVRGLLYAAALPAALLFLIALAISGTRRMTRGDEVLLRPGIPRDADVGGPLPQIKQADGRKSAPPTAPAKDREPRLRSRFPETLYWNPEAVTDDRGIARLTLPAADSITTWKLAVSAIDAAGRLGSALHDLTVFQEFFVDPALPVALTAGDEVTVPVSVYNYRKGPQEIRVALDPAGWFAVVGSPEATVRVGADEVGSVKFRIRVREHGWKTLKFVARGEGASDAIERTVQVVPNGLAVDRTQSDRFRRRARVILAAPADAIPGATQAWVRLFPSTFSEIIQGLESLLKLPYG